MADSNDGWGSSNDDGGFGKWDRDRRYGMDVTESKPAPFKTEGCGTQIPVYRRRWI
jgi:hypothetical protein